MGKLAFPFWLLLLLTLTIGLTGCELTPTADRLDDIAPAATSTTAGAQAPSALQFDAIVRLEPTPQELDAGATGTIQIRLDNVTDMSEISLQLRFAPDIIQIQDSDLNIEGIQIQPGDFFDREFVETNDVNNAEGLITYYATPVPVSGSNRLLATIFFQTIVPGVSDLNFSLAELATSGEPLSPITAQPGQIIVNSGPEQPTPTATFTLVPGQPTATLPLDIVTATFTPLPVIAAATETPTPTNTPLPTATSTPIAPQIEIPPGATVGQCYRVQPGDTLYSLAQQFGTDPQFISLANDLYPPGHIYPQQVLFMPTAYGRGPNVYQIQSGDTLFVIGERCHLEVDFLAWVNGLMPDANLADIEWLIIPRPPYAPPSRYPYPQVGPPSVWPPPCRGSCY